MRDDLPTGTVTFHFADSHKTCSQDASLAKVTSAKRAAWTKERSAVARATMRSVLPGEAADLVALHQSSSV